MSVKVDSPSPDLQDRLRFETMLSDLSSRFVNLEPTDVGIDLATPVVETIGSEAEFRFTGKIQKVTIEVK